VETARYFNVLKQRKWVILLVTLVTAIVVFVLTTTSTPTYTATVKLRVAPFSTNAPDYGAFIYFDRLASTYSELVNSDVVTDPALALLGLDRLPDYLIETIPQTELLRLAVIDPDPVQAATVANTLAQILVEQNRELFSGALSDIQETIGDRLGQLQVEIDTLVNEQALLESQLPRDSSRIAEIATQVTSLQQQYSMLLNNSNQALVSQANQANALTILELASPPEEPSSASPFRMTILASVIGLLAGIALAFIIEALNPRLYNENQIFRVVEGTIKGRIPKIAPRFSGNVYNGDVFGAEAFRRLSTNVSPAMGTETGSRVIIVTSSIPGEGKSTIAANLARSLARNNQSIALVDCDMRRPTQHTIFEITPNGKTLRNVLTERTPMDEALENVGVQNLQIIPAGKEMSNSTELLNSDLMIELTTHLKQHFDIVILDTPALLAAPDALALAPMADECLMIVDLNKTTQNMLGYAYSSLRSVGVEEVGIIVNRVKRDATSRWRQYYPKPARRAVN
jgi:capsular exopolysaccharide synthesis family protein